MVDHLPYQPSQLEKIRRVVQTSAMLVTGAFLVLLGWWLFYPYQGLTVYTVTLPDATVQAGGLLRGEIHYCVGEDVPLPMRLDREIVLQNHSVAFPVTDIQYVITSKCETKSRILGIPAYAPPGTYRLAITTSIQVNPLRTVRQTWKTSTFEVVK